MTRDWSRAERAQDIKETLKCNKVLIHYYELLLNNEPENHLSFQAYLREIDVRGDAIKAERLRLIASFDKASNGSIPELQRHSEELREKLTTLRSQLSPQQQAVRREKKAARQEKKTVKMKAKAKSLFEKIVQLEKELKAADFDFDSFESDTEMEC